MGIMAPGFLWLRVTTEREVTMSNLQNITINGLTIGFAVSAALILAAPIAPASAQGVPAGLLRLDTSQPSYDSTKLTEAQQAKLRSSYARVRKHTPAH
jgi:hypothetical protein